MTSARGTLGVPQMFERERDETAMNAKLRVEGPVPRLRIKHVSRDNRVTQTLLRSPEAQRCATPPRPLGEGITETAFRYYHRQKRHHQRSFLLDSSAPPRCYNGLAVENRVRHVPWTLVTNLALLVRDHLFIRTYLVFRRIQFRIIRLLLWCGSDVRYDDPSFDLRPAEYEACVATGNRALWSVKNALHC
jgi:hypothetical protein